MTWAARNVLISIKVKLEVNLWLQKLTFPSLRSAKDYVFKATDPKETLQMVKERSCWHEWKSTELAANVSP